MEEGENIRAPMPLDILIECWEKQLGEDDPLNPPNMLGELIEETLWYLKGMQKADGRKPVDRPELEKKIAQWLWCKEAGYTWSEAVVNDYESGLAMKSYHREANELLDILVELGLHNSTGN